MRNFVKRMLFYMAFLTKSYYILDVYNSSKMWTDSLLGKVGAIGSLLHCGRIVHVESNNVKLIRNYSDEKTRVFSSF